jgi:Spy/CpxP family protein refolding chaperone
MMLMLGQAAISQEDWAAQYIETYRITPEQVKQLGVIERRYSKPTTQFRQALNQSEQELNKLMVSSARATQFREKARQFEALQVTGAQLYFEEFLEIREMLTQEQRRQFDMFKIGEGR